jgi:hypothetical protein
MKKKKKKIYQNYEELLLNSYGTPRGGSKNQNLVLSKSFDNGEILIQEVSPKKRTWEYIVQSSVTEVPFEEYIVTEVQPGQEVPADSNESSNRTYMENDRPLHDAKLALLDKIAEENKSSIADTTVDQSAVRSQSFETTRFDNQNQRNDDDFVSDIEAILKGKKVYDPEKKVVRKPDMSSPYSAQQTRAEEKLLPPLENKHAIFDQIKQSMEFAKAYDLGSVDIEKRFSDFDKIYELQKSTPEKNIPEKMTPGKETAISSEEFLRDLNEITRPVETPDNKVTSAPVEKINGTSVEKPGVEEYVVQSSIPISYSKSVTGIVSNAVITDPFYRDADEKKKLTNRSGGRTQHLGIDVSLSNASGGGISDSRRGLPVHAAVKKSIPISDLNSVRTANGTGMGLKGDGNVDLLNAVV